VPRVAARDDLESTGAGVEETRELLLDAAAGLFAARGYHRTTIEDVVAEAGVAKGTVYWYYRSKKALFLAVIERAGEVYRAELVRRVGRLASPLARLEGAIEGTFEFAKRRPDLCRLYFQEVLEGDADFVKRREAIYAGLVGDLRATLEEAVKLGEIPRQDLDVVARAIAGSVEAVARAALHPGSSRRRAAAELRAFVLTGLRRGRR
jgi:AcrR family transcriptional regulator